MGLSTVDQLDVEQLRADTPGATERIHLNNAGAGLMPTPVLQSIQQHLELESKIGGYEAAEERQPEIDAAYTAVAGLINARDRNIAFCENATVAYSLALSSIDFQAGDLILTTEDDYVSNQLMFLSLARRFGIQVVRAPNAQAGGVDLGAIIQLMDQRRPKLVAVTHIPTNSGLIQPVAAIGQACREREIWYLVDGCQSVGQVPIDVQTIGCDFFSASFRKFLRGPRGIGFLYASDRVLQADLQPLFPDLQGANWETADTFVAESGAKRFENWEFAFALLLGAGTAARYSSAVGIEACSRRSLSLARLARSLLAEIGHGIELLDHGSQLGAIVTAGIPDIDSEHFKKQLDRYKINISISQFNYAVIDFTNKGVNWALRISPHYYNTELEVEKCVAAIDEILSASNR